MYFLDAGIVFDEKAYPYFDPDWSGDGEDGPFAEGLAARGPGRTGVDSRRGPDMGRTSVSGYHLALRSGQKDEVAMRGPRSAAALARLSRVDLARLRVRRLLRTGEPYRPAGVNALVAGTRVRCFNLDTLDYLIREIFLEGCYEMGDLGPRPHIVDVGANIGMSVLYSKRRHPEATIHAIEADPDVFGLLSANVGTMPGVSLSECAVGDRDGTSILHRHPGKPGRLTSSLLPERGGQAGVGVAISQLSGLLDRPVDLLKMDIEGGEHAVLPELDRSGALDMVRRLVVEVHVVDTDGDVEGLLGLLAARGFQVEHDWFGPQGDTALVRATRDATRLH